MKLLTKTSPQSPNTTGARVKPILYPPVADSHFISPATNGWDILIEEIFIGKRCVA